jgi:Flp pilus assembly protein TadG
MVGRNPRTLSGRFRTDRRGATALEFALIAPILFCSLFAIIEIGVMSIMSSSLDNAVAEVARRIRTNREDAPAGVDGFKTLVCARFGGGRQACAQHMSVSVQKFSHFSDAAAASPVNDAFDKGEAGDIIVVRVNYRWPLITPFLAAAFPHADGNQVVLAARTAFKNEPYS